MAQAAPGDPLALVQQYVAAINRGDAAGAAAMHKLGVNRVVLARENTLEDIREIHNAVPGLGLESFIHGALCISYSGQCYMSGMISESDGSPPVITWYARTPSSIAMRCATMRRCGGPSLSRLAHSRRLQVKCSLLVASLQVKYSKSRQSTG